VRSRNQLSHTRRSGPTIVIPCRLRALLRDAVNLSSALVLAIGGMDRVSCGGLILTRRSRVLC
jgi:hypothetical protein